ncbi:MAG: Smr/MutS family protein [Silvanigrellales bacterium]|nr:Smr/MutS family protein [Silvanigrellales bacterium]
MNETLRSDAPERLRSDAPERLRSDALDRLEWKKITAALAECAVFESTQRTLAHLAPTLPAEERTHVFRATAELRALEAQGQGPSLEPVDTASFLGPLSRGSVLSASALWQLRVALGLVEKAFVFVREQKRHPSPSAYPLLLELFATLEPQPKLHARLGLSVDAEGNILSSASPELRAARGRLDAARKRMESSLESLLRRSSVRDALQDALWMQRDGRYVLPVRTDRKGDVPGVPRGVSQSGSTVFVEPTELATVQGQIEVAETDVQVEEARVLRELSEAAHLAREPIGQALGALELYDALLARARFANILDAVEPRFHTSDDEREELGAFAFYDARHPLFILEKKPCVPNDLVLKSNVWVLSGPNAGGKTVAMKTAGVLTLMGLAGLFVPASEASLFAYTHVYAEMGDRQNLSDDLSTFSGHLVQLKAILSEARTHTLVLLDEGFVGTDPTVGVAMARATLESLATRGATVVITTHFSGLKTLAEGDTRFQNASMEFESRRLKPTYRLQNGIPGQSYALELASRLGFEESLLNAARSYAGEEMMRVERLVAELSRQKEDLENLKLEQEANAAALRKELDALRSDRTRLETEREALVQGYREKLTKRLNAFENRLEIRERQFEKAKRETLRALEDASPPPSSPPGSMASSKPAKQTPSPLAPPRNVTLTGFDALKGFSFQERSSGAGGTRAPDRDDLAARIRKPEKLTPRDLLDEARTSLGLLNKGFDALEDGFRGDVDAFLDLEESLTGESGRTGKTARERLKMAEKEKAEKEAKKGLSGHPDTYWKPGMKVRTQRLRDAGEVLRTVDSKGLVECKFGLVKMKVPHRELFTVQEAANGTMAKASTKVPEKTPPRAAPSAPSAPVASRGNRDMSVEPTFQHKANTLDLRGSLVDTALEKVEAFLDRAMRDNLTTIIIIHGHGTGRVKQAVRELLQETRFDLAWRPGTAGEGSDGVTVVRLN